MTMTHIERPALTALSFGKATDNGLWTAMASKVSGSAAGSGLAGLRPGQPISAEERPVRLTALDGGMFGYEPEHAVPLWDPDDSPAAA